METQQVSPEPGSHLKLKPNDLFLALLSLKASHCHHSHLSMATQQAQLMHPHIKYLLGLGPGSIWGRSGSTHKSQILLSKPLFLLDSLKQPQKGDGRPHPALCEMGTR